MMRHKERSKELTEKVQMAVYDVVESLSLPPPGAGNSDPVQVQIWRTSFNADERRNAGMKQRQTREQSAA